MQSGPENFYQTFGRGKSYQEQEVMTTLKGFEELSVQFGECYLYYFLLLIKSICRGMVRNNKSPKVN